MTKLEDTFSLTDYVNVKTENDIVVDTIITPTTISSYGDFEIPNGDLILSGNAARIKADFTDDALNNRTAFQTTNTLVNSVTALSVIPGTGSFPDANTARTRIDLWSETDVLNSYRVGLGVTNNIFKIISTRTGTRKSSLPISFEIEESQANTYSGLYIKGFDGIDIANTGNVGIDNKDPKYKLDVNGTINANGHISGAFTDNSTDIFKNRTVIRSHSDGNTKLVVVPGTQDVDGESQFSLYDTWNENSTVNSLPRLTFIKDVNSCQLISTSGSNTAWSTNTIGVTDPIKINVQRAKRTDTGFQWIGFGGVQNATAPSIYIQGNGANDANSSHLGFVGINNTDPKSALDVHGDINLTGNLKFNDTGPSTGFLKYNGPSNYSWEDVSIPSDLSLNSLTVSNVIKGDFTSAPETYRTAFQTTNTLVNSVTALSVIPGTGSFPDANTARTRIDLWSETDRSNSYRVGLAVTNNQFKIISTRTGTRKTYSLPINFEIDEGNLTKFSGLHINGSEDSTTAGYVGIGTSTPAYKLDVDGGIHTTGNIILEDNKYLKLSNTSSHMVINGANTWGDGAAIIISGNDHVPNQPYARGSIWLMGGNQPTSKLYTTGFSTVGIATTNPSSTYALDVNGKVSATAFYIGDTELKPVVNNNYYNSYNYSTTSVNGLSGGSISGDVSISGKLTTTGYVGIGTTTPGTNLDVSGTTRTYALWANGYGAPNSSYSGVWLAAPGNVWAQIYFDGTNLKAYIGGQAKTISLI